MVNIIFPLVVFGLALVTLEVFLPGFGVAGISGIICFIAASIITAIFIPFGYLYVGIASIVLVVAIYSVIKWAKSKQLYGNLILKEILAMEKKEIGNTEALIGKEGVAVVPLKPFGVVDFNGIRQEVFSDGAFIPKGRTIKVVSVKNDKVFVREMN